MTAVREPAVAGSFYPAEAEKLRESISMYLEQAESSEHHPKALIAPHAGYMYSGPIAATAYACLAELCQTITRVVLAGPSHHVAFHGVAVSTADTFMTPLGEVHVDRASVTDIAKLPHVHTLDEAHAAEHALEVHLPFLQEVLGAFTLIPLVIGQAETEEVADVFETLWGGPETLIVVSSDLSHYHAYDEAQRLDEATSRAIEELNPDAIAYEQACGRLPIQGLLTVAKKKGLSAQTIDLRNSGDTAGSRDQVVGYGAYVIE